MEPVVRRWAELFLERCDALDFIVDGLFAGTGLGAICAGRADVVILDGLVDDLDQERCAEAGITVAVVPLAAGIGAGFASAPEGEGQIALYLDRATLAHGTPTAAFLRFVMGDGYELVDGPNRNASLPVGHRRLSAAERKQVLAEAIDP